jgi:hypothetical protein
MRMSRNQLSTQSALESILSSGNIPAELEITYDDTHALWGGTKIVISGDGVARWCYKRTGRDSVSEVFEADVSRSQLLELLRFLLELAAWEQRSAERPPVPDESRAVLTIRAGGRTSVVWERVHEMEQSGRLVRVKAKMLEMVGPG